MKFGLGLTTRGIFTNRETYLVVARAADKAGFDYLAVTDHLITPRNQISKYPYTISGAMVGMDDGHCLDQLTTVAFLAACTEKIRLLTSVMVVPHRPAVLAAKMLATIDVLSNGRLILGVGAGWMQEEIETLGAQFETRGKLTDETLAAFKELWTKPAPAFDGSYVKFKDVVFEPKPIQKPHPPIWIGGAADATVRRAAELATACNPSAGRWRSWRAWPQKPRNCWPRTAARRTSPTLPSPSPATTVPPCRTTPSRPAPRTSP